MSPTLTPPQPLSLSLSLPLSLSLSGAEKGVEAEKAEGTDRERRKGKLTLKVSSEAPLEASTVPHLQSCANSCYFLLGSTLFSWDVERVGPQDLPWHHGSRQGLKVREKRTHATYFTVL